MGALMRTVDWSRTPVGPPDAWPQSLRTALSILLETGFPMYIAWGPEFTQFYNDGYRPILGSTKHPALGKSTRETFAEIWHIIGPMFAGVMNGTPTTVVDFLLPLDRHGFVEECYFIFSYSPIRQERGDVGGVLVTVTETTARVLGARRLKTLQDLADRTRNAASPQAASETAAAVLSDNRADIPFALIYLLDRDGTTAHLGGTTGLPAGMAFSPREVAVRECSWPLAAVIEAGAPVLLQSLDRDLVVHVNERSGQPPASALVLPVMQQGEERVRAILVAGLSPRLMLDDAYRSFLTLVAGHIATAIAAAQALQDAQARADALAELDRAKTLFFSNVSHEFRTPLALMLGPTEDALRSGDPVLRGADLQLVHRNQLRLLKLVNTLLDFSRIESGRTTAHYQKTDIVALTRDLASVFQSAIDRAGLRLAFTSSNVPDDVWLDRDMWEKVILNLLSNALKHTFEGTIRVGVHGVPGGVQVTVADTGVGIPADQLGRVFERFHLIPATRARTYEGTGIGLALVHELVRLHGGTVTVHSAVGAGTTFTVQLPAGSAHLPADRLSAERTLAASAIGAPAFIEEALRWLPDDATAAAEAFGGLEDPEHAPRRTGSAPRQRILVADDNADMRRYVARLLQRDFDVETALDGQDALEQFRRRPFDLVVADVMMPRLDGLGLLDAIRADPHAGQTPVVLLSARAGEEARVEGLESGADDYVVKPFNARELIATVRAHATLAQRRREFEHRERLLERKAADASAELDRILSNAGEGIIALDYELRYVYVNRAAEQLAGMRKEDVFGRRPWEVFPPEVIEDAVRKLREAAASQRVTQYEIYMPAHARWYEHRVYPTPDALTVFFTDVTARKRAEHARVRNEQAQQLLASVNDAARELLDPEAVMRQVVQLVGRHFGVGRCVFGEVDQHRQHILVQHDYTDGIPSAAGTHPLSSAPAEILADLASGRTIAIADVTSQTPEPEEWGLLGGLGARAVLAAPLVKDGRFVAVLALHHPEPREWSTDDVALVTQVAERTWAAVAHARAEAAMRESRDVLSLAMRGGRMGAWSRNLVTDEVWWSRELEEIFGLEPGGFAGTEDGFMQFVHDDDRARLVRAVAAAIETRQDYVVEFRFRHTSGEWRWMEGRGRAVYVPDGTARTLYGLGIDITDRKRSEEALARARDAAESANRLKDQFLATLSHELRTPLNAILGYATMLRRGAIAEERRDRAIEVIERNAVAQAQLVEDLLDISRITSGKVRLEPELLPIAGPLLEALESIRPAADAKRIVLDVGIDPFAGTVYADPNRLRQVFWNLLSNAVKFTAEEQRIGVSLARDGGLIRVAVSDSGQGIAPDFLPHVFDAFRQADGRVQRQHGGLGLGLAICKQLVELHGGTIDAASEGPGRGAVFTVRLPARAGGEAPPVPAADR